jgi:TonB-linked SusC/RagA family outer membrane protein
MNFIVKAVLKAWPPPQLIMRINITTLFLIVAIVQTSAKGYGQITLSERNVKVERVLKLIKRQAGYTFFYNKEDLDLGAEINVNLKNAAIDEALGQCFKGQDVTYKVFKKTIIVKKKMEPQLKEFLPPHVLKGRVTDEKGQPLPGVGIKIKGASQSSTTNADGEYSINIPGQGATVVFSFIGFASQEVLVTDQTVINIRLVEAAASLNQVIVVGYGTQKKANLTGAVDQIGSEVFEDRPLPSITRGLQGVMPNLNIRMTDGKPTRQATYNIRGTGSIGAGGSALVLIDGVAGDPNLLNPNDVETVSILKDAASSAIYGARGAFGVVLITTKKPATDKIQVGYSTNYTINQKTVTPRLVSDGYTWAQLFDEAYFAYYDYKTHPSGVNNSFPFSLTYLDELKAHKENPELSKVGINSSTGNYVYYGNTDWMKELYRKNAPAMEHSLNFSGGSEKISFYLSGRYYKQDGVFRYSTDDFNKYNLRAKGDIKVAPWLTVSNNLDYSNQKYFYPLSSIYRQPMWRNLADQGFPMAVMFNPDGTLTRNAAYTIGEFYQGNSNSTTRESYFRNTTSFTTNFFNKQLKINGDFTYSSDYSSDKQQYTPVTYSVKPGETVQEGISKLSEKTGRRDYYATNIYGEFSKEIEKHAFKALLGYNLEFSSFNQTYAERDGLLDPDFPVFNMTDGLVYNLNGGGDEWGIIGGFYRLNYSFNNRYLVELNGRYDGSSKFPENQRFGFFPSASAGWRISEEQFMKPLDNWLNNLKLRASYGSLGNGNISPYRFIETMSVAKSGMLLNGVMPSYVRNPAVLPNGITWEKATTLDIGADIGLFKDRLNLTYDWYDRQTTGMFTALQPLPATFGSTVPQGNNADLSTKGWELSVSWRDQIKFSKPLSYNVRFVLSDNKSRITKFNNPTGTLGSYYTGQILGDIWGYETEGLFTSLDDIATHANQNFIPVSATNTFLPGDVKFKDLNGDRFINNGANTLADHGDLKIVGNTTPRYAFGLNLGADWNNFSISAFFQGIAKRDWWPGNEAGLFWGQYGRPYNFLPEHIIGNYWTADNPDAYFPRYRGYAALNSQNRELVVVQTRYLQDASYIRLKTLTLNYALPESFVKRIHFSKASIFFTGQNLWTYSPMYKITKNFDPEVIEASDPETTADGTNSGNGYNYPMLKSFTMGLNITF